MKITHSNYMKLWHKKENKKYPWKNSYEQAKGRCLNPSNHKYPRYGGRGIKFKLTKNKINKLWFRDKAWLLKHPTIDRIDNDGNYTFDNCRFIENVENVRRSQSEKVVQLNNKKEIVKIWNSQSEAERLGGFKQNKISRAIKDNIRHKGFYWQKPIS